MPEIVQVGFVGAQVDTLVQEVFVFVLPLRGYYVLRQSS